MSFPSLPLFTGDYLRDTRHLSPMKHGLYLLLLMHSWDTQGPIPLDETEQAGICNARSADEIESMRYVLDRYFVKMDDGFYNERMMKEIERFSAISRNRSNAASARWKARGALKKMKAESDGGSSIQVQSTCSASAMQMDHPNPSKPKNLGYSDSTNPHTLCRASPTSQDLFEQGQEELAVETTPEGFFESAEFETRPVEKRHRPRAAKAILAYLNSLTGRSYEEVDANLDMIKARLGEGYTITTLRRIVAMKVREWLHDEQMTKYLRPATLFNRTKCAQYRGEIETVRA